MSQISSKFIANFGGPNGVATLDGGGKVPLSQLPASLLEYKGNWSAATNTPTLANGTGVSGYTYINTAVGTVNFGAGNITFAIGDWVIYDGAAWNKSINSNAVSSVNTQTGTVVLTTSNIAEGTNLYYTDARAQASITGGASTITTSNLTTNSALISNGSGKVAVSPTTSTELGFVSGVTSAIQTQLTGKASTTLNNLGSTAFNVDIVPATSSLNVGSTSIPLGHAYSQNFMNPLAASSMSVTTAPNTAAGASGAMTIGTGNIENATSGAVNISTGGESGAGTTGNSGNIAIQTGNATGVTSGTSGNISILTGNATTTNGSLTLRGSPISMSNSRVSAVGAATAATDALNANLPSGDVYIGNGSGIATAVAISGDVSITNAGVTAVNSYTGTVPLNKGGTGQTTKAAAFDALQPMTTSGDIIYGGASGTGTRLPVGSNGQFLGLAAGIPTWGSPAGAGLAVTTKTSAYTATSSDDIILASGSAFTITLPSTASTTGKILRFVKTDASFANIITIHTGAGDQFGDGTTSTTLNTQQESLTIFSDGAVWRILVRNYPTSWTSYTPTGAWTSNTTYSGLWMRTGNEIIIRGKALFTGAPNVVATGNMTIPSGLTINISDLLFATAAIVGKGIYTTSTAVTYDFAPYLLSSSTTSVNFGALQVISVHTGTVYPNDTDLGTSIPVAIVSGAAIMFECKLPVTGWN